MIWQIHSSLNVYFVSNMQYMLNSVIEISFQIYNNTGFNKTMCWTRRSLLPNKYHSRQVHFDLHFLQICMFSMKKYLSVSRILETVANPQLITMIYYRGFRLISSDFHVDLLVTNLGFAVRIHFIINSKLLSSNNT